MDRKVSPPLAEGQRTAVIAARVTPAELAAVKAAAARAGRGQHGRWVREVVLAACGEDAPTDPQAAAPAAAPNPLAAAIRRVGLLLNQAIRLGNIAALQGDRVEAALLRSEVQSVKAVLTEMSPVADLGENE